MAVRQGRRMPMYAEYEAFTVSGYQLKKILKGRNPFKNEPPSYDHIRTNVGYRITMLKDGTWWVKNFRDGAPMFAPDYWHSIDSKAAIKRAIKLRDFVEAL